MLLVAASCTGRGAPGVSTILYVTGPTGRNTLHLLTADGSRRRALPEREVADTYYDLSPDGRRVLYSDVIGGAFHWWILPLDGSEAVQVPAEGIGSSYLARWLHDGQRIVVRAADVASGRKALYVLDPGAKTVRRLPVDGIQFACSATDSRVAVLSFEEDVAHIAIVDVDTGQVEHVPAALGPVYGDELAWSPDGSRFALLRDQLETEGGLLLVDARRGEVWPAGLDVANTKRYIECLGWSPDGGRLLFVSDRARPGTLSVLDVATGKETPLVEDTASVCPCWSPDGREIGFVHNMGRGGGPVQVCTIDVATGRIVALTDDEEWKFNVMWGLAPAAVWAGSPGEGAR